MKIANVGQLTRILINWIPFNSIENFIYMIKLLQHTKGQILQIGCQLTKSMVYSITYIMKRNLKQKLTNWLLNVHIKMLINYHYKMMEIYRYLRPHLTEKSKNLVDDHMFRSYNLTDQIEIQDP